MTEHTGARASWTNWSGAVRATPARRVAPETRDALRTVLREAPGPVRMAGSGHSFVPLCAGEGTLVTLDHFSGVHSHDPVSERASIRAGTPIHAIGLPLFQRGLGLINQGDIDRQTLAGAVSTGTHGTGRTLGGFPSAVTGLTLMTADGTEIVCDRQTEPEIFEAARLSLGALGVLTDITVQCREAYKLEERVWPMDVDACLEDLPALSRATRHFEFLWFPYADQLICKSLAETDDEAPEPSGATGADAQADALESGSDSGLVFMETARRAPAFAPLINRIITRVVGKAGERAGPSVRWSHEAFPSPRDLKFNEMEYAVPADQGPDCLRALVAEIRRKRINVCFPIEYRFIAADDVWLSPFRARDSVSISVHQYWKQDQTPLFDLAESIFRSFQGRPHWGKMHGMKAADLAALYPHFDRFRSVRDRMDPCGRFLSPYLTELFRD